jgi:hypothetical protein
MIANGSAEFAKAPKTFSSRASKPQVQTCRRPPPISHRRLSTNLGASHASLRSRRNGRLARRKSKRPPSRNRYGARPRLGVRAVRSLPPNTVVSALTNYGMTQQQVAELYGVTVEVIWRTISRPDYPRIS